MNEFEIPSLELQASLQQNTAKANGVVQQALPLDCRADFEAATQGLIASLPDGGVSAPGGRVAWDIAQYDFLDEHCPETANPSLWRMAQLNKISGLFEVTTDIWQARGCDYANMSIIRGQSGWIIVDPLMTRETASAVLQMVNETLGERPVSAILITHTHPDHFGGLKGITGENPESIPPIYAPEGFMAYAASEGVMGGNHTSRRAIYQFGLTLVANPAGVIDGGIGKSVSKGRRTFIEPSHYVRETGEELTIDGVRFIFQMASGTEAPAEFTFYLPDHKVLCMAEVCTQTQHNILPPRGAQVRDALLWARTIDEAINLFVDETNILINSHNWPVWGAGSVRLFMEEQRDVYKYIHDQTLRLANHGHTPHEIADLITEPEWLSEKFHSRGYYGTLKFNARAVYQFYYGFFDGHPVNLDPLPPEQLGRHIVEAVGGLECAITLAQAAMERDELQWAATLLNHVLFGSPANKPARKLLTEVYRHQGYRAESGIMRNIYLTGAAELERGVVPVAMAGGRNEDLAATLGLRDWFDAYAVRLNPERALNLKLVLNFLVYDKIPPDNSVTGKMQSERTACVSVVRQTEFARMGYRSPDADVTIMISQSQLERLSAGAFSVDAAENEGAMITGNRQTLIQWLALHDTFDLWFNIVTP